MKKILFVLLMMVASTVSMVADDFEVDGIYYNLLNSGEVTVTNHTDYFFNDEGIVEPVITHYSGDVVIPETVNYRGATYMVTRIDNWAFNGCTELTSVVIPNSVTYISDSAFENCSGLTSVTMGNSVTVIKDYAFRGCSGLEGTLEIPDSVTNLGGYAFDGCWRIEEVVIGSGMVRMQGYYISFRGCSGVKTMTILAETPPYIADGSYNSYSYASYFFGSSGLSSLETIWVPEGTYSAYVNAYGSSLQQRTRIRETGSEDFIIENGVLTAYVGDDTVVTVPEGVKEIGASAFRNNSALESVEFPEGLEKIGANAFQNCTGLKGALELPESLTEIGGYAFYGCSGLAGALTIPAGVATVGNNAFYNCSGFTSLSLPEGLTGIGSYAFYGCTGLKGALAIPSGITAISTYAFYNCSGFTSLSLPEGLTGIGSSAFYGCTGLKGALAIPSGTTAISTYAFYNCSGLTSLSLPESLSSIGAYAFYGCSGLSGTLEIPAGVTAVSGSAFRNCSRIEEVILGSGVKYLYANPYRDGICFGGCSSVKTMTILAETPPYAGSSTTDASYGYAPDLFGSSGLSKLTTIYVLPDSLQAYKTAYSNIPSRKLSPAITGSTVR